MEGYVRNDEKRRQLLDLIPKEREWLMQMGEEKTSHGVSEEKKLELRLGPPDGDDWSAKNAYGYVSNVNTNSAKRGFTESSVNGSKNYSSFLKFQSTPQSQSQTQSQNQSQNRHQISQESSQSGCTKAKELQNSAENKAFSLAAVPAVKTTSTAVPNTSAQKRTAPAPVVGWPPIRSFRKNLASSSSVKTAPDQSQNEVPSKKASEKKPMEVPQKGLFVKINMDGIPIGRKVDLKAYDNYQKLSTVVDELFRGLLAAQSDPCAGGNEKKEDGEKEITGLLDGSGEYTLVYEDNEGDRMLVGDVPWHMFVSTVRRLRVLKSSDLSTLSRGSKQE